MTFAANKLLVGREPVTFLELDLDFCSLTYGVAPCTASGAAGSECYNTRQTCDDAANFTKTTKTYRFVEPRARLPVGIEAIPCVAGPPSTSPTKITPGKGLGARGSVTVTLQDFPHHDRGVDPYVATRSYTPAAQGTFFGKLLARNPFYRGRIMRVRTGYLTDTFSWDNFQDQTYVIDRIEGPDSRGQVRIVGKDLLKLADNDRAQAPRPSTGELAAAITDSDTSATLSPTGIGDEEYPASGYVRIAGEVMAFTRSGDTLTLTRAQKNTQAKAHDDGDTVQLCLEYSGQQVHDIVYDLLTTYAGIDAAYIDTTAWDNEAASYLTRLLSGFITEPTGVNDLLTELTEQGKFYIWWDERDQLIKLRALRAPGGDYTPLNDEQHFLADSIKVAADQAQQKTQIWVYYGQIDPTKDVDDAANYKALYIDVDTDAEGASKYDASYAHIIYARWITDINKAAAVDLAEQLLNRLRNPPKVVDFRLDVKDSDVWTGAFVQLTTRMIQDETGAADPTQMQILEAAHDQAGSTVRYKAQEYFFPDPLDDGSTADEIILSTDVYNFDLLDAYESLYLTPSSAVDVEVIIETGVTVGATS